MSAKICSAPGQDACRWLRSWLASGNPGVDQVLAGAQQRPQREPLVAGGRERGKAVTVGSRELAEHERIETVVLACAGAKAVASGLDLVGVNRKYRDRARTQPSYEQPARLGAQSRAVLDLVATDQLDQRADAGLVMSPLLGREHAPRSSAM